MMLHRRGDTEATNRALAAWRLPEVLDAPPGRVYTGCMTISTERPEFEADDIARAVSVGVCLVLAAVLLALAGLVQAWS